MLAKRATLVLLAGRALSAFASPVDHFTVQDPTLHVAPGYMCGDTGSVSQLEGEAPPEVHLDDGIFTGARKGAADHFLGIPFAYPP